MQLTGLFLLVLVSFVLVWIGLRKWGPLKPHIHLASEQEQLIIIAQFLHSDTVRDRDIAEELKSGMVKAIEELSLENIRIETVYTRLLSNDVDNARKIGNQYKAHATIWGTDTGQRVTFNVLNLRQLSSDETKLLSTLADFDVNDSTFIIPPSGHNRFSSVNFFENRAFISSLMLGQLYDIEKNYQDAILVLAKTMASVNMAFPPVDGLATTYFRLGWIYHVPMDNPTLSMRYYSQALELDPSFVNAYNNRGVLRLFSNDPTGALADFDQALRLNPKLVGALMSRGTLYTQLGQLERAVDDYTSFLNIAGESVFNIAAYFGRGSAKAKLGLFDEAIVDFSSALAQEPDDNIKAAIIYSIANTLKQKALRNQQENPDLWVLLLEQASKDYKTAIGLFSANNDKASAYFELGFIHDQLKQFKLAVEALNSAILLSEDTKQNLEASIFRSQVVARLEQVQRS